ncbi:hypothetical protein PMEGAPR54_51510 [Priestia megaterium]
MGLAISISVGSFKLLPRRNVYNPKTKIPKNSIGIIQVRIKIFK